MILAVVLAIAYSVMFLSSVSSSLEEGFQWEETINESLEAPAEIVPTEAASEAVEGTGTAEGPGLAAGEASINSPAALGTTMRIKGQSEFDFEIVLGPSMLNANNYVAQAGASNPAPPSGMQYVAVDVAATYIGSEGAGTPHFNVEHVSSDGVQTQHKDLWRKLKGASDRFDGVDIQAGAPRTATFVMLAKAGDMRSGKWVVIQPFWTVDHYFKVN